MRVRREHLGVDAVRHEMQPVGDGAHPESVQLAVPADDGEVGAGSPVHLEIDGRELSAVDGGEHRFVDQPADDAGEHMRVRQVRLDHVDAVGMDQRAGELDRLPRRLLG